jgi:serine/threonine protein kinase
MYLVFEFMELDLKKKIDTLLSGQYFPPMLVKWFLYQLLSGVAACHSRRIIHRDLKP